jgi:hypothetical protein
MLLPATVARLRTTIQESSFTMLDASLSSLGGVVPALTVSMMNTVLPAHTMEATTASSRTTTTRIRSIANAPSLPALQRMATTRVVVPALVVDAPAGLLVLRYRHFVMYDLDYYVI